MLDENGFDLWADAYDRDVRESDERGEYPFAGYREVHQRIYECIVSQGVCSVLDVGFGTGVLTSTLYARGCRIFGIDFSPRMVEIARKKMPAAAFYCCGMAQELPEPLQAQRFDFIVSTYAIHHLTDAQKVEAIRRWLYCLAPDGEILIGDVAFENRAVREACRADSGDAWDDDEAYFAWEDLRRDLGDVEAQFVPVSYCAGIIRIKGIT